MRKSEDLPTCPPSVMYSGPHNAVITSTHTVVPVLKGATCAVMVSICLPLCSHHDWQTGLRLSTGSGTAAAAVHQAMVSHSKDLQDVTVSFPDSKVKDLIVLLDAGYTLGHF